MNRGFISLALTISVAGTLLVLVGAAALDSALFFDQAIRKEYRAMNYFHAGNCIDQAILSLAKDYFYRVDLPVSIPFLNCSILSAVSDGNLRHIKARGDFQKAYVYRNATILLRNQDLEVVRIE